MSAERVIKFRAWNKKMKRFAPEYCQIQIQGEDAHVSFDFFDGNFDTVVWDLNDCEIMQFTGLHDKNGKEIYEGDIVRIEDDYADNPTIHAVEYGVGYAYPAFEFNPQLECECNGFSYVIQGGEATIEVIGNTYETPELLEQQQ